MASRSEAYLISFSLVIIIILARTPVPIRADGSHPSTAGNLQTSQGPHINRTLGTPTSGFWNGTLGTGALLLPQESTEVMMAAANPPLAGSPPASFSWNGYFGGPNYMTPVKNQGSCGSCWDFAAVGDMEAQYRISKNNTSLGIDLSEQHVLSCSGGSCSGWYIESVLDFLVNSGTPDEACNPYVGTKTACGSGRCSDYLSRMYVATGWTHISTDTTSIKNWIYTHGPVIVWMPVFSDFPWYDAAFWQSHYYGHSPSGSYGGHAVVIVGWYDDDYWIVRNSWGTSGGDVNSGYGGYFYMTQDPTTGFFGIHADAHVISDVKHSQVTMTLSYSVLGGGAGYSGPTFNYVQEEVSEQYTLTTSPTPIKADYGSSWSVTPNPLSGSTSLERWWTSQSVAGSATAQTIVFVYKHQYNLTMWVEPPDTGTLTPSSGWQDAGKTVTITATPNEGYGFSSWNGSGYTGRDNPSTITMNGPISETANLQSLLDIPLSQGWNLVSLPLVPTDATITTILHYQIARGEVAIVWSYTGTPRAWKFFIPGKASTLTTMVDGDAYWIYMRGADTLYVDGYVISPTKTPPSYPLVVGWNLVGFKPQPTLTNETVSAYLSSIGGRYDVNSVWLYNNSDGTWVQATDSTMLFPGDAMWVRVTAATTLYPE